MNISELPHYACPSCEHREPLWSLVQPGDICICTQCFAALRFDIKREVQWMTLLEWIALETCDREHLAMTAFKRAIERWQETGTPVSCAIRVKGIATAGDWPP